ncbi:MAG: AraC family transcriptional regulator ligand-binding domain-containing protein [Burkholderiales bacterium]|nr:AraC family transcriptional regulator ligand-binding domain-containing protein [Burkholderiales bacterium]
MTILVRAASLHGYEGLARSIGVDAQRELERAGLSAQSLADPDALIPYVAQFHLLEHTATVGNCPDFGLRLSECQGPEILGPLAVLLRHAATLGDALDLASRHLFVHSPAIRFAALPVAGRPSEVDLAFSFELPHLPPCGQSRELALGVMASVVRQITQARTRPMLALIPHARIGPSRSYARVLDCECRFEAPVLALRIAVAQLSRPLPEHNPMLRQLAQSYVDQHFGSPDQVFADRVRSMVRRFLGSGQSTQASIAGMLSIHPRTMQRRLLDEGHRFEDIVDSIRREMLVELLSRQAALSLSQIALMLGYSEQAALTRSCRRWFDCTPTELRASRQAAQLSGAVTTTSDRP